MNIKYKFSFIVIFSLIMYSSFSCHNQTKESKKLIENKKIKQDSIVLKYLKWGAWRHSYFSSEWQIHIDSGLKVDHTIAYLWQQKGMPYMKCGKYEIGMNLIDSAVYYDLNNYLNYRAFLKCIFQKNYKSSLEDFNLSISKNCEDNIMDHTRHFYMGLCYLQLNDFFNAEKCFNISINEQIKVHSKEWVSYIDKFYLAITFYELRTYDKAVKLFDEVLKVYEHFADTKYYKALSLKYIGNKLLGQKLLNEALIDLKTGYTINEGNSKY